MLDFTDESFRLKDQNKSSSRNGKNMHKLKSGKRSHEVSIFLHPLDEFYYQYKFIQEH